MIVGLRKNAIERLAEKCNRGVVGGHEDRDQWLRRQLLDPTPELGVVLLTPPLMPLDPRVVILRRGLCREDFALLPHAELEIMQKRVHAGACEVRIALQITQRAKVGAWVATLGCANRDIVRKSVVPGARYFGVVGEVPFGIKEAGTQRALLWISGEL